MILEAIVRRFPALKALSEATTGGRLTGSLSLAVSQVESEHMEMTRAGRRFNGIFGTVGQAPVQAVPTTAATWALYNADSSRSYVIDSLSSYWLSGTAAAGGLTFLGIVSPITATLPVAAATAVVGSASAGGLTSKAILAAGAPGYTLPAPVGMQQWGMLPGQTGAFSGTVPALGTIGTADVRGRVIIPPGKVLGIAVVAPTGTTDLFVMGATWHELELDLE